MANRNTQGFGLIPAGTLGATPSTGGQNKYKIDSGYATSLYLGQPVQLDTAGGANTNPGYVISGQDAITRPTIGVFNGCFYTDANYINNQRSLVSFRELQHPLTQKTSMHLSSITRSNSTLYNLTLD